jgi:hypothetical protein
MTYYDLHQLTNDEDFRARVTAAAAKEGNPAPEQWMYANRYTMAAAPGFSEDYGYAVATGVENPGRAEEVISDAEILSQYQALNPPPPPVEPPDKINNELPGG